MHNTVPTHEFSHEITTEMVVQVAKDCDATFVAEAIETSMDDIHAHVDSIVPPAKNAAEQVNDIRAALNETFSDFNFGATTTRKDVPNFNQLVRGFEKKGMDHTEAIEHAADAIEILKRIETDQPIFDTPLRQIQDAFTNVDIQAVSNVGV